jgi:ATP-dependent 26S proteasome regulatory subunit
MTTSPLTRPMADMVRDETMSAQDRADMLLYAVHEEGLDHREALRQLLADADIGRAVQDHMEGSTRRTLASERFLGAYRATEQSVYAVVTHGPHIVYLPASTDDVARFRCGESILIDMESRRIVGRDGAAPLSGDIVTIESRPPEHPQHAVIRQRDQLELVRLHSDLLDRADACRPGDQVLYDPVRKFILAPVTTHSSGEELLLSADALATVRRADVGGVHPVVDEIRLRFAAAVEHPDWTRALRFRQRCSYLWVGGTGTGKSYHLKLLATEIHDIVEAHTGQRQSRVVMLDASTFWSSYFGETEQRIAQWAAKLQQLGSRALHARDGRAIHFPLIVCLEEAESLLRGRGETDGSGHLFDRSLSLFLQKTESLENALQVPIIWIATSNRPDLADSAALRRVGMRRVTFDMLTAPAARLVLLKKVPPDMPMYPLGQPDAQARAALVAQAIDYLFGAQPPQDVADVTLLNGQHKPALRQDMVTPALLEEAVSAGIDAALRKSMQHGRLVGLDADDVVHFLHNYFVQLAPTLHPHNIAEYCPRLFRRHSSAVRDVQPVLEPTQRPLSLLLDRLFS